jgi:4-hydroxy-2-oxoheptanedioate aldolase
MPILVYLGDTHLLPDAAMHEAVPAITSYGVSPIVRVPDFQSWMIKRM